jgi:hypothetical protein
MGIKLNAARNKSDLIRQSHVIAITTDHNQGNR